MLVRNGTVAVDEWKLVEEGPAQSGLIAPLDAWRAAPEGAGVWLEGDAEVEEIGPVVIDAPVIAVRFPVFEDGRGLTLGTLLRSRYGYSGELRAFGEVIPDLAEYMHRCGFNAFAFPDKRQAEVAIACIQRMSDRYQGSVRQRLPAYRRMTNGS